MLHSAAQRLGRSRRARSRATAMRRIGVFIAGDENDPVRKTYVSAVTHALAGLGWTDGRNMRIDLRWSGSDANQIRVLAPGLKRAAIIV